MSDETLNVYESFGATAAKFTMSKAATRTSRHQAQAEAVQRVRDERSRLHASYNRMRDAWKEAIRDEHDPDGRLASLIQWGKTLKAQEGARLIQAVRDASWLVTGHPDLRFLALVEIDDLISAIKRKAGQDALNDPLPPGLANPEQDGGLTAFWIIKTVLEL